MKHDINWFINGIRSRLKLYYGITRIAILHLIAIMLRPWLGQKHYWVLHERGDDAQDNAWHLLKYLRREHPEINARYAIRTASLDYSSNLADYKDVVVEYNSFRYYMILFNADVIATTHIQAYLYPHNITMQLKGSVFDVKAKKIFLQHGVTRHKIKVLAYPGLDVDCFICGAKIEHELMMSEGMNYPPEIARYTGLARYDNLWNNVEKNQILIMPTWRIKYSTFSSAEFLQTDFFKFYQTLLTNSRLLKALKEFNFDVVFYNHYEFQKFNSCFNSLESENVHLMKFGTMRVQELLKQSKILITDYSSIYYDFLFMGKPIVFVAQNEEEYETTQYGKRYDGLLSDFGYDIYNVEEALDTIIRILESGCQFEDKFKNQQEKVFPMRDNKNCERIYEAIQQTMK